MARYLNHLDSLKEKYITTQNSVDSANYPFTQFHYYQNIEYIVDKTISFSQTLRAVKLVNTAILLIDPETQTKVYFTDDDITSIIAAITGSGLKDHIINGLKSAIAKKGLDTVSFNIDTKTFNIKGIPFKEAFNDILCENPADIKLNGNDLIALINLILEKERADKDPKKLSKTATKYIGLA